ncbi:MAG: transposase [bacterium]|nr:transposase [bacterium]
MPRPLRITIPNIFFHILNRGNNRQAVFRDEEDFIYFLRLLKRYKKELRFRLFHFCLMPNHIHFVLEPTIEGSLSKILLKLTLAYTRYFNKKYQGVGHVWQGRFKSSLIDKENYFIWCGLYTELNPVRAMLVVKPEDWKWSSYRFYALGEKDCLIGELIDPDPYYLDLGEDQYYRQTKYRENVAEVMKEKLLENIHQGLDRGVFGGENFVQTTKEKFKIGSPKPPGRPRKDRKEKNQS